VLDVDTLLLENDDDEDDEDDDEVDDDCADGLSDGVGLLDGVLLDAGASAPMRGRSDGPRVNGGWVSDGLVATSAAIPTATAAAAAPAVSPMAERRSTGRSPVFCDDCR
jgi:hypothetical protein